MTPKTNESDAKLRSQLRILREKFFDSLIAIVETTDSEGKAVPPAHQELSVIRGVLRDNSMTLLPDDAEGQAAALRRAQADLPDFDDDSHD